MELIQKNWYVIGGIILVIFLFTKNKTSSGQQLTQISAGVDPVALFQIASAERDADENRRYGMIENLLSYDLSKIELGQRIDLAKISSESTALALRHAMESENNRLAFERYRVDRENEFNQFAVRNASNSQRNSNWLQLLNSNLPMILSQLFSRFPQTPPFRTPPTFPSGSFRF